MLCSTIIPSIGRPTLARSVVSALDQQVGPENHEIIVINDSGQPLPAEDWMSSERVRIFNVYQCGESIACNTGVAGARGKYINFLHDDDFLLPQALGTLIDKAELSGASWTYGAYEVVDENQKTQFTITPTLHGNVAAHLAVGECIHICSSLINRDGYLRVGGCDPMLKGLVDWDLQCRMALEGDFVYVDSTVARIRRSLLNRKAYNRADRVRYYRNIREKVFNSPGALSRLRDSTGPDPFLRGRVSRSLFLSSGLSLLAGRPCLAAGRLLAVVLVAGGYALHPTFWRGTRFSLRDDSQMQE